jgi:hypothetical protein
MRTRRFGAAALAALVGAGSWGCNKEENPTRSFEAGQVEPSSDVRWDAPTKDRLAVPTMGAPAAGANGASGADDPHGATAGGAMGTDAMKAPGAADGISSVQSNVKFAPQEGWKEVAPTAVRLVNVQAGDPAVECYVTVLAGDGGGAAGNVNRWRQQVGLPPASAGEIDALPHVPMLGGQGLLIEAAGAEKTILGTVSLLGGRSVFVKMIGPGDLVAREKGRFMAFCGSLSLGG